MSASLSVTQPYLLTHILKALEPRNQTSIQSFPLHSAANALPLSFYAFPNTLFHYAFPPSQTRLESFGNFGGVSAEQRNLAYFYAVVGFFVALVKSQADLQHLYYARRASVRIQSELIASIYEKALVRKDIAGVVASDAAKKGKVIADGPDKQDEAVKSADVGKIVSLMATDANKCASTATAVTVRHSLCALCFHYIPTERDV